MNSYYIEPRAALVFRSGRPFGQGGDAQSLSGPLPSSLAGAVRTCWAEQQGWRLPEMDQDQIDKLQAQSVLGPLLAQRRDNGVDYLFPRPADALYLTPEGGKTKLFALQPAALPEDAGCDLPAGLRPVWLEANAGKGKPAAGPKWWLEKHFYEWLLGIKPDYDDLQQRGWVGPISDPRTHVSLEASTQAGIDGLLYQTEGVDYRGMANDRVFVFSIEEHLQVPTLIRLGGEARPSVLQAGAELPKVPDGLVNAIKQSGRLRLVLLTPAIFDQGWKPEWLDDELEGCVPGTDTRLKLEAAAVPRWEPVSGWDLRQGKPKALRRMVPAGAVYWFRLLDGSVQDLWLRHISDQEQDRRDGFGLAVPAHWKQD